MKFLIFLGQLGLLIHLVVAMTNFPSMCLYNPVELFNWGRGFPLLL
jgi:hypothetical protein